MFLFHLRRCSITFIMLILSITTINSFHTSAQSLYLPTQISWSPDGSLIAGISNQESAIYLWDADTGALHFRIDTNGAIQHTLSWSAESNLLATIGETDGVLRLWDATSGKSVAQLQVGAFTNIAFNPNGTLLAGIVEQIESSPLLLWSVDGTNFEFRQTGISFSTISPVLAWSSDGSHLATMSALSIFLIDIEQSSFKAEVHPLKERLVTAISWKPDDQQIAVAGSFHWMTDHEDGADDQIDILNVQTGDTVMTLEDRGYHFENVQWSPDGNLIAGISVTKIAFWDASTGQQVDSYFRLRSDASIRTYSSSWSPFGSRLAFVGYTPDDAPRSAYWLAESLVKIVVPAPSLERLKAIAQNCITNVEFRDQFIAQLETKPTPLVTLMDNLHSSTDVAPACAADLLAVAAAIQAAS